MMDVKTEEDSVSTKEADAFGFGESQRRERLSLDKEVSVKTVPLILKIYLFDT